ncbi:MAG: hypothetical protein ACI802_000967, partial [Candidatus Paceibacteria bacterium]
KSCAHPTESLRVISTDVGWARHYRAHANAPPKQALATISGSRAWAQKAVPTLRNRCVLFDVRRQFIVGRPLPRPLIT